MRTTLDGAVVLFRTDEPGRARSRVQELSAPSAQIEAWALAAAPQDRLTDEVGASSPPPSATHLASVRGATDTPVLAGVDGVVGAWTCATTRVLGEPIRDDDVARIAFIRRHPGLTTEQFLTHYFTVHIPMVLDAGPLFTRYTVRALAEGPWDAVVEQVFPDVDAWNEHDRRLVEEKVAIRDDLHAFIREVHQYAAVPLNAPAR